MSINTWMGKEISVNSYNKCCEDNEQTTIISNMNNLTILSKSIQSKTSAHYLVLFKWSWKTGKINLRCQKLGSLEGDPKEVL